MTKYEYMQLAIELAKKGMGYTSPNPMVGCVVVKQDKIVTQGYHERYGEYHAERNALTRYPGDLTGAEMYVTLEPCCHHGNTPPCTDIIIEKGIRKVYVGSMDPNPKVAGKGVQILRDHGIEIETGILEKECLALNEVFFHFITTKRPYVVMKYAMTLDGKIAASTGDSKWVTGEEARRHAHFLRKKYRAIMVGIGTVLADNPLLNCRIEDGVDPIRVVCDSHLRIPADSQIVKTAQNIPTIVCFAKGDDGKIKQLQEAGVEVLQCERQGRVDLDTLMKVLGQRNIDSVLIEGGGTLHGTVLKAGLVNEIYGYIAPKLIGGEEAKSPVEGKGFPRMQEAKKVWEIEIIPLGDDICIHGYVR